MAHVNLAERFLGFPFGQIIPAVMIWLDGLHLCSKRCGLGPHVFYLAEWIIGVI